MKLYGMSDFQQNRTRQPDIHQINSGNTMFNTFTSGQAYFNSMMSRDGGNSLERRNFSNESRGYETKSRKNKWDAD